jgi:class 3 adenylate cyclase
MAISLKRLVSKPEHSSLLTEMLQLVPQSVMIIDQEGKVLLEKKLALEIEDLTKLPAFPPKFPIQAESEILGWVVGEAGGSIATLLNYLVIRELERKSLITDTLEKYKEINLLYRVSSELGSYLNIEAIANFVLSEASRLIKSTSGCLLLIEPQNLPQNLSNGSPSGKLKKIAAFGQELTTDQPWEIDRGITGDIIAQGNAEIINNALADPRFIPREYPLRALICSTLNVKGKVIGLIVLSHDSPIAYTAADLKLLIAISSQAAAAIDNTLLHEHKLQEERIKTNLGRYVASQVVDAIFAAEGDISLAPVKKNVTILFSDIRNFTTQCELLAPEQIVEYLNGYFTAMVEEIFSYGGTVNKFVGDMIVAIFGAPSHLENHEQKAIETAIAMQQRLQHISVDWIRENFHTGIGISSGEVVVGNVGSPQHMDYTAIGDEVNIASRLQSLAKGGQILVSRSIYELNQDKFDFKSVGSLNVKGKHNAVEVFEVIY